MLTRYRVHERPPKRKRGDDSDDDVDDKTTSSAGKPKRARSARERSKQNARDHTQKTSGALHSTTDKDKSGSASRTFDFKYTGIRGLGPEHIESDVDWMRRWMLLSSSNFYTYPHHDAAGLVTWTTLLNGMKLWSYIVPKNPESDPEAASKQYVDLIKAMNHISVDTENRLPELAVAHNFFLSPQTLL